jgi:hypothetical protein
MSKLYKIQGNAKLFYEWMRVSASPHSKINISTWGIVQNDMVLSGDELNDWWIDSGKQIEKTEQHFKEIIEEMKELRDRTAKYIQQLNK